MAENPIRISAAPTMPKSAGESRRASTTRTTTFRTAFRPLLDAVQNIPETVLRVRLGVASFATGRWGDSAPVSCPESLTLRRVVVGVVVIPELRHLAAWIVEHRTNDSGSDVGELLLSPFGGDSIGLAGPHH